jgi:hypothetical protein
MESKYILSIQSLVFLIKSKTYEPPTPRIVDIQYGFLERKGDSYDRIMDLMSCSVSF